MKLDLASFAFGAILIEGTGTPPWGTSFGQNNPDYKFVREGHEEIIVGMLYNAVDLNTVSLPLGKGGCFYKASEKPIVQLASVFNNVFVNGEKIDTPPKELELIYHLASNPNRVFTRDQLLDKVWGFDYLGDSRTVDVHVKRLREKLEGVSDKWELRTVWGVGYKFETKD